VTVSRTPDAMIDSVSEPIDDHVGTSTTTATPGEAAGPLAGVRVLELGNFIAGPFAGQLFGDYGAEVIKIEAPDGDPMRHWGVTLDDSSLWWPIIARNKRSVVADLKNPGELALVQRLASECDVILENFRPGVLSKYGLDRETVARTNPGVIVTHVSGFGQTGPRASEAGFGSIGEAVGGIRHTTGDPDRPPARCGVSLGDSLAAMFAVIGTLAALHERSTSGLGQEVDVAIYEAVAALMESSMVDFEVGGVLRQRSGGTLPGVAPANAYPTRDGSEVLIAGNADTVFARLCDAMGRPDLAGDDRYATHVARGAHERELDALVAAWTSTVDSGELLALLREHSVPAGRVYTAADMLSDEHYRAREMIERHLSRAGVDTPMLGVVPKFSRTPGAIRDVGPALGEHTDLYR
jgi:formyl-CoA transferase